MAKGTHRAEVQLCSIHQAMCPGRRLHSPEGKDALLPFAQRHHMGRWKLAFIYPPPGLLYLVSDRHLKHCITKTESLISSPLNVLHPRLLFSDRHLRLPSYSSQKYWTLLLSLPLISKPATSLSALPLIMPAPLTSIAPILGKTTITFCLDYYSRYLSYHSPASNPPGGSHILKILTPKLLSVAYRCLQTVGFILTCKLPTDKSWPGVIKKGSCPRELPSR